VPGSGRLRARASTFAVLLLFCAVVAGNYQICRRAPLRERECAPPFACAWKGMGCVKLQPLLHVRRVTQEIPPELAANTLSLRCVSPLVRSQLYGVQAFLF